MTKRTTQTARNHVFSSPALQEGVDLGAIYVEGHRASCQTG